MSNTIIVTSAVKLTTGELAQIKTALNLSAADELTAVIDPNLVAGIRMTVNGKTVDLTIKHQLAEIENI